MTRIIATDDGLEVTALHNHFFFDKPNVYFMHIEGEGRTLALAKAIKAVRDAQGAVRRQSEQPRSDFGIRPSRPRAASTARSSARSSTSRGSRRMGCKVVMGRKATASCGSAIGKAMGVNTWAAFGGTNDSAVVDGDFAVSESELQPVLKALRAGNINVVAIHSHMTGENPRILFLHFWGRGPAATFAATIKGAVDRTAWDGRAQGP